MTLRVKAAGRVVSWTVILYPEDEDWECDCDGPGDVCEHVAAAVVAVRQAHKRGEQLPRSRQSGARIAYRLQSGVEGLGLLRVVVAPDAAELRLEGSLASKLAKKDSTVSPSQADLQLDRWLTARRRALSAEDMDQLCTLLSEVKDVRLDGEVVEVSGKPVYPRVEVGRTPSGLTVRFSLPAALARVVAPAVGLSGEGCLVALAEIDRWGPQYERLPHEERVGREQVAGFLTEALPELRRHHELVEDEALPTLTRDAKPRLVFAVESRGPTLSVLARLVYGEPPVARIDGDRLVHLGGALPRRDRASEARLTEKLTQRYDLLLGRRAECTGRGAIDMAERLRSFEGELIGSDCLARFPNLPLRPTVSTEAAQLMVSFAAGDEDEGTVEVAAEDVLGAWRSGDGGVAIDGGGYAPLPIDWLRRYGDRILDLLRARDGEGRMLPAARPALLSLCDSLDQPRPADLSKLAPLVDGFDGIEEAELPSDLTATLRPYQQRGVDWLSFLRTAQLGALLADDMGLGKTLQALCAVRGRCLIVCPTSVMHNWAEEAARFRPGLCVGMYHGSKRALDDDWDLTITSYSLLRRDIEKLEAIDWQAIVLDEAQAIKNPDSQVARAAYRLRAPQRIAMSGTPVENRLQELWSQMHFVNPGLLAGRENFRERFVEAMESGDGAAAAALRSRIRPFVLRRHKRDVLPELPPRTDMVMYVQLEETEREQYEALKLATRKDAVARLQAGGNVMAALEALLRLRQMACHPGLVPGGKVDPDGSSSKLRRLSAALDKVRAGGHKALVFSQWTGLLDRLEPGLRRDGFDFVRLDGTTRDRGKVVREFQDGEATLMLVSLKAGGTGLNLTAADHVFLLDPWWNPAVEDQAADRAHRIGQDKPVMVYRLVAHDTVEERILVLQEKKRAIAEAALGEGGAVSGITREDLLDLLR